MTQNVSGWLPNLIGPVVLADEGTAVPARPTINFTGAGVAATDNPGANRTDVTIASGGAVPTGTGLRHVVANVEAATATLIVNADVDPAAAIAGTKVAPNFGAQDVATTTLVQVGPTAKLPTIGLLRVAGTSPTAGTVLLATQYNGTTNYPILSANTGMRIAIGADELGDGTYPAGLDLFMAAATDMRVVAAGATVPFAVSSSQVKLAVPVVGNASPYSAHGKVTDATAGSFTVVPATYQYDAIVISGATAGATVTFPLPATDAVAYYKTVINTSGVGKVIAAGAAATTITITTGNLQRMLFDATGVHPVAAAVAYP